MPFSCLRDQTRQIFLHVAARRQHERVRHDLRGTLLDAAREPLCNRGLGNLHVGRLHDRAVTHSRLHEPHDLVQELVGCGAAAAVVDQENRPHASLLGPEPSHVNLDV